ncbi:lysophospholipid acyltransferase family protein [Termitidicoccus mucosus]|uniref:DUF374 domain-containing protein n=1 Tax=Termitidicoccus mucosus TaxID=1184151 RepID=A0A178IFN7_9BACT|nr:hypothetical protein AW736_17540 [Opitutaceae bacterium TSB47]
MNKHYATITKNPALQPQDDAEGEGSDAVHRITGWRRFFLWPLSVVIRLWTATLRIELSAEARRHLEKNDEPLAIIFWHNRLFVIGEIYKRHRRPRSIYGLVSGSKDGAWLAEFFDFVGIKTVRGSSTHNPRGSVSALVRVMREGHDIGITPDGPRGPLHDFKGGGLIVARRVGAPVLLLGQAFESAWRLRSWDRFYLPRPFSRIRIYCMLVPASELGAREAGAAGMLRLRLLAISPDGVESGTAERAVV